VTQKQEIQATKTLLNEARASTILFFLYVTLSS